MPDADETTREAATGGRERGARPATPLWVKLFAVAGVVVVVLFVVVLIAGGHGPGRHASPSAAVTQNSGR